jgi:hypothetical protein
MFVPRCTVALPFAQSPEENQGQADLFGLSLSSTGVEQSCLAQPMDQSRQAEDHGHPMVRVRRLKLGPDHLAGDPPMGGSGIEPLHHGPVTA